MSIPVPLPTVRLILIRHGECEGGAIFRGHCDVAPTELGQQQLQQSLTQAINRATHTKSE
ncbi:hypothetical protein [Shewanella sp. NIFS-20-20]|uniref:hypothetical protein n=1 Tax=Shewanella sp. NIFS-20-20 TaxID=2853806 RepID=UPI001C470852|nr:hypothetical protein [Shewanella sp. NIFS-20-20]MBV7317186.1 hypothetical protein [Shewanella sp. NIFS-20-20]